MGQTSYDRDFAVAFEGMKADARFDEVLSFQAENAIAFGRGVIRGTNKETQCKLPSSSSDKLLGVALHQHKQPSSAGVARYEDKETVNVLRKGAVHVPILADVAAGDTAYMETATSPSVAQGAFTNLTSATTAVTGCIFASAGSTASTPAIAQLEINLP